MSQRNGKSSDDYTHPAHDAILLAATTEHDFGGWLAGVLASVAADLGSSNAPTAGRPGSRKPDLVQRLVKGTVGRDDEYPRKYRIDS